MKSRLPDKKFLLPLAITTLLGCSTAQLQQLSTSIKQLANHDSLAAQGPESCRSAIAAPAPARRSEARAGPDAHRSVRLEYPEGGEPRVADRSVTHGR